MGTQRLTVAQAIVAHLIAQTTELGDGSTASLFPGVYGIFGHGNVTCLGHALEERKDELPTWRGQNEQGMALAATAYNKAVRRRQIMTATSSIGPGATNMVTPITDAMMDSVPLVVISGQVPTHLIGTDAFQEADTTGITRSCAKHNYLVTDVDQLAHTIHEAFHIATSGRPGPVVIDIPKDVQFATGTYSGKEGVHKPTYSPRTEPIPEAIEAVAELISMARRPVFYTGGGVINSGPKACEALRKLQAETGIPVTSTLMGLGAFPASHKDGTAPVYQTRNSKNGQVEGKINVSVLSLSQIHRARARGAWTTYS